MDRYDIYRSLSRSFARQQLVERFCFEIRINKLLFDEEIDLRMLMEDTHSSFLFSEEEYKSAYDESMELSKEIL